MNHISLFSGIGGWEYALQLAGIPARTVLYCEADKNCRTVIQQRVRDGVFSDAPICPDVRTLDGRPFAGRVGIITASFPCQPHSTAGQRRGADDDRNLWPDTARLIREIGPEWVALENVAGIAMGASPYAGVVVRELSQAGYDCEWGLVSASDVGASHQRKRWWCVARRSQSVDDAEYDGRTPIQIPASVGSRSHNGQGGALEPQQSQGSGGGSDGVQAVAHWGIPAWPPGPGDGDAWATVIERWPHLTPAAEPPVRGVADGVSNWSEQLKAVGNGIVPAVAALVLKHTIGGAFTKEYL